MIDEQAIWEKLQHVRDPEFGKSIMERELVDSVEIEGDTVRVRYHLTVPFCPKPFALHIGREIREKYVVERLGRAEGVMERFYAITVERRLKHPAVVAISEDARLRFFGDEDLE